ncbi:uncharacterized protein Dere_GG26934 [Drosophila erecta]|uniref:Uncharacterized protein n=1 Tax=Drosophila erecta TaxID=7220 RepID=A0A0Q5U4F9_DROER|nr:uncharacterized protein Dere_GG26934 [Drosophila erecta]
MDGDKVREGPGLFQNWPLATGKLQLETGSWEQGAAGGQFILITVIKESAANKVEKAQLKWSSLQSAEMVSVSGFVAHFILFSNFFSSYMGQRPWVTATDQ